MRFLLGQSPDESSETALQLEHKEHGDLWRFPMQVTSPWPSLCCCSYALCGPTMQGNMPRRMHTGIVPNAAASESPAILERCKLSV